MLTQDRRRQYRMATRASGVRARHDQVLDAAIRLFTEQPYTDVSLDAIAATAGVTKRTILRRFGSKESLFAAAMWRGGSAEMERRDQAPAGDIAEATSIVVDSYERWGRNRLRMLAEEERIEVVAENAKAGRDYHWSWVERVFAPLLEGVEPDARRRRFAALVLLTDVYTWKVLRRDLGLSPEDTKRAIVELIEKLQGDP